MDLHEEIARLLTDSDEGNDAETRKHRRVLLRDLAAVVDEWLGQLEKRGPGPTAKEYEIILDHLERRIAEARKTARKLLPLSHP